MDDQYVEGDATIWLADEFCALGGLVIKTDDARSTVDDLAGGSSFAYYALLTHTPGESPPDNAGVPGQVAINSADGIMYFKDTERGWVPVMRVIEPEEQERMMNPRTGPETTTATRRMRVRNEIP